MCAKFVFSLLKTAVETVTMLKEAVKDKSMSMYEWFNHIKRCEMSVEDEPRCGPPLDEQK